MKSKKMFLSLVAIIFSIFIGYNIYSVENSQQTFDVSFLNIEALASGIVHPVIPTQLPHGRYIDLIPAFLRSRLFESFRRKFR